ncbi:MAG TPA: response regulator [Bacillota bacterium]|jgi:two-component system chemotaxis response regulator CheY|nr:response regulator [Candidatus Fermentithermobacillaceae bacterium]HOB30387.1 response regulator [Bacillota bacterium]HOK64364.1 response regulator [Bacillota bacterium]HOL11965.1 response regulator [Bacillota bacterium]HOQ02996.1 response regulator [Bacillota bacterium]
MAKILVVDDAMFMRNKTSKLLQENGYEVVEASNGEEAVARYMRENPDLVLMDITMPVLDGIESLKQLRAYDPEAKVVMVTALGQKSMVLEAIKAGARDFIVKPFQPDQLLEAVRKQCEA